MNIHITEEMIQCRDSRLSCGAGPRNTVLSMLVAGILGWVIGFVLIGGIGSGALFHWELMPLLPLFNGVGWAMLGMIVGGSGLFDKEQRMAGSAI
jgi:hypothetical protein